MRIGNDMAEIMVSDIILRKQDQMISLDMGNGTVPLFIAVGRHVSLAADNGLEPGFLHGVVKLKTSAHDAVVGNGTGFHSGILDSRDQIEFSLGIFQFRP